ncbi:MAG: T9SS C-terminal target domain-containing protein [Ignavibacteriales bacterium]|nr:MAG: T9SS C-terminal target domain-containing protein [Ignavibacteriales bacterium]
MNFKNCLYSVLVIILVNNFLFGQGNRIIQKGNRFYLSNKVIVKLKTLPPNSLGKNVSLPNSVLSKAEAYRIKSVSKNFILKNDEKSNLNRILSLEYSSDVDPVIVSAKLSKLNDVEWAEPHYVYPVSYVPNDPSLTLQYNLSKIQAESAWDITKGDTSIIIGIVDTGIDWDHPDLAANMWVNKNEIPANGVDDDKNGFVDDYRGWDFGGLNGTPDNDPIEDKPDHGTHVAGIASAVTNNGIGVASIGYNSKLMAVKTSQDNYRNNTGQPYIIYGYEGIAYAADNGAKVINCSWGGSGYSQAAQDVIDYAVSKGALVVAAAGNESSSGMNTPSGLNGVMSVASTDPSDYISSFSNYDYSVDVSAPGSGIYSTWMNDTYTYASGTSMSSPLVAGLAALVFSKFPTYKPLQVAEQVRVNSDNIDALNPAYAKMIGWGRINAYKALTNTTSKSIRAYNIFHTDATEGSDGDGIYKPNENVLVKVKLRNYLNPLSNLSVSLQSESGYATVITSPYNIGAVSTMDSIELSFIFNISGSVPENYILSFFVNVSDGSYTDFNAFSVIADPTYQNQTANEIDVTITSTGNIGFNDYPDNQQGIGFSYKNQTNMLFEGALMYGVNYKKINDVARSSDTEVQSSDFTPVKRFIINIPGSIADQQGYGVFNDEAAGAGKIGIETHLSTYSFADYPYDKFIILNYKMINKSAVAYSNFYAGLFFDWDMTDGSDDVVNYDDVNNIGYVYHNGGSPDSYLGAHLLSSDEFGFYAIANAGDATSFSIFDGFTDTEKWQSISSGIYNKTAGPGDISFVISSGPYNIPIGDSINVAFALAGGDDLNDLVNSIQLAQTKYDQVITDVEKIKDEIKPKDFNLAQNYPNPFNPATTIKYQLAENGFVSLKIYDMLGNEVEALVNKEQALGTYNYKWNSNGSRLASGIYLYVLSVTTESGKEIKLSNKLILLK